MGMSKITMNYIQTNSAILGNDNLIAFGYISKDDGIEKSMCDMHGRTITDFSVSVNSKGHYEVVVIIDGQRHRRFVRPNMNLYTDLTKQDIYNLPADEKIRLAEILFPPKQSLSAQIRLKHWENRLNLKPFFMDIA